MQLIVKPLADIPKLIFRLHSENCVDILLSPQPAEVRDAKVGSIIKVNANVRLRTASSCVVTATIVSLEEGTNRFGSVYAVTFNPGSIDLPKNLKRGVTAAGERTIDAPAGIGTAEGKR